MDKIHENSVGISPFNYDNARTQINPHYLDTF